MSGSSLVMANEEVKIEKIDGTFIKVHCENSVAKEISDYFTFKVPNSQYSPAFKRRVWDGQIRLFNYFTRKIYTGLRNKIVQFCLDRNYECKFENFKEEFFEDYKSFIDALPLHSDSGQIKLRDYQQRAVEMALDHKRSLLISPTGSGKSLIIYTILRYLLSKNKKILVLVPTTSLVHQMRSDFIEYSGKDWNADKNIHIIYAGKDKETTKPIAISTWQSVYDLPEKFFAEYDAVIGDECHLFKAKSLVRLMNKLRNCHIRIGTTGTLDNIQVHKLVLEGLFGPPIRVTSTKNLIDNKVLSNLDINCIQLKYAKEECDSMKRKTYQEEIDYIISHERRNKVAEKLCASLKGNTLVLFSQVQKHGLPFFESIQKTCTDKKSYFISGMTDAEDREEIRKIVDKSENSILVASYGTCSTGINIKNIHNIVFLHPSKSVVRVLQSIGRGLRMSETKDRVMVFDLVDDLRHKKYRNHAFNHFLERIKIYESESFSFNLVPIDL